MNIFSTFLFVIIYSFIYIKFVLIRHLFFDLLSKLEISVCEYDGGW